jgi:hypothetical protein
MNINYPYIAFGRCIFDYVQHLDLLERLKQNVATDPRLQDVQTFLQESTTTTETIDDMYHDAINMEPPVSMESRIVIEMIYELHHNIDRKSNCSGRSGRRQQRTTANLGNVMYYTLQLLTKMLFNKK